MSEALWIALIQFGIKFGLDAAIAISDGIKNAKNIDDAIAALKTASEKTAQQYVDEAE